MAAEAAAAHWLLGALTLYLAVDAMYIFGSNFGYTTVVVFTNIPKFMITTFSTQISTR